MKNYLVVAVADVLLVVSLVYVLGDLQWRAAYAASAHGHTTGYVPSFSYSLFTRVFTMTGNGATLASPLTLDWVQVLGVALIALNGWAIYVAYNSRRRALVGS